MSLIVSRGYAVVQTLKTSETDPLLINIFSNNKIKWTKYCACKTSEMEDKITRKEKSIMASTVPNIHYLKSNIQS